MELEGLPVLTRNLLAMQAELVELEAELEELRMEDRESISSLRGQFHLSFRKMRQGSEKCGGLQWKTMIELREKLNAYNQAVLQAAALHKLPAPAEYDANFLADWIDKPSGGYRFLRGSEARTWQLRNRKDFVAVTPRASSNDTLTTWISNKVFPWLCKHRLWIKTKNHEELPALDVIKQEYSTFDQITGIISTITASLLPTLCIIILYFVRSTLVRLILIMVFTSAFAMLLMILTDTRRVEVFAACAAFAAVQVVFVGSPENRV